MKENRLNNALDASSSKFLLKALVVACTLAGNMSVQASTTFLQEPTYSNLVPSYQSSFENGLWVPKYYDDFSLANTDTIDEIRWVGGFADGNSSPTTPPSTGFTLTIFANNPNINEPSTELYSTIVAATAGQVFNRTSFNGVDQYLHFYDYHATLPTSFLATAGTVYWLSVQANNTGIEWDWATAGSGRSIVDTAKEGGGITRLTSQNNLAFSLHNNTQNIPEPSGFALLGIGMLAWWGSSRAKISSGRN